MSDRRAAAASTVLLLLMACGSSAASQIPVPTASPSLPPASGDPPPAQPSLPALTQPWATATLTDVTTGETFRVADIVAGGSVVFLETMAIWCTNCRVQQTEAVAALSTLDPARVEWVGIDVESSETADALVRYTEQNGFPFRYVIADVGLARALVDDFGDIVLSPPSVNIIVIGTDGRITALRGHRSADELVALAIEHGA